MYRLNNYIFKIQKLNNTHKNKFERFYQILVMISIDYIQLKFSMIFKRLFQIHTYISLILPILFQLYYDTLEEFESVEHSSYMPHIMAIGAYFSCLLKPMIGRLDCWGNNSAGQTDVPGLLQGQVHSVKAEQSCICALSISRELLCWGSPFSSAADHANTGVQDYSIANDAS